MLRLIKDNETQRLDIFVLSATAKAVIVQEMEEIQAEDAT
jgi:hypothetical protein